MTGDKDKKMQIEYVDVKDLKPYPGNPRINSAAVDPVAKSIREFRFRVPLVIGKDMTVICGHTRLEAAKKLHLAEVPCVRADGLTDEQIRAFRIADNSTAGIADFDTDLLIKELGDITLDMSGLGLPDLKELIGGDSMTGKPDQPVLYDFFFIRCDIAYADRVVKALDRLLKDLPEGDFEYAQNTD